MVDLVANRTVPGLLAEQAERHGAKPACVFEDATGAVRTFTYSELHDLVARVATGFAVLGVRESSKVVVHLPNCPEVVLTYLALARLGAVVVPSNTANRVKEMTHVIGWSDATVLVTSPTFSELFEQVLPHTPAVEHVAMARGPAGDGQVAFDDLLRSEPAVPSASFGSETPLEILFTSGTTSLPKGVVLTHANWLWSGERASNWLRVDDTDRLLTVLPLFHVNAQSFTLLTSLTVGATAIFLEQYSARRFMDQVRGHGATHTSLVAMLVRTLLAQPAAHDDREHALRRVSYAINVTDAEKQAFEARFGVELLNGYGLSEAMTDVTACPVFGPKRWPSVGRPSIDREVRLVGRDGSEVPTGEVGEITVKGIPGRTLMKEYYKDPEATALGLRDGWLHTGDNGFFDEHGYLYFFDRAKDIIKCGGENVSASEVEVVLAEHASVAAAAVIGVPDPIRDEAVMAFVVLQADATLTQAELVAYCTERLARFKVPSVIVFRDALPLTSIGKVEKRALRSIAASVQEMAR